MGMVLQRQRHEGKEEEEETDQQVAQQIMRSHFADGTHHDMP